MRKYMNVTLGRKQIFGKARFVAPDDGGGDGGNLDVGNLGGGSSDNDGAGDNGDSDGDDDDIDAIRQELAKAKAENQRFKNSINKLTEEKKKLTNKNREMMSADQLAQEEREERDRKFAEMEKELRTNRYSKKLVGLGMTEKDADTFASNLPEIEDSDNFFATLGSFITEREKSAANKAIQELLKNRPDIHAGNGDAGKDDPAMALAKRSVENRKKTHSGVSHDIIKNFL